MFAAALAATITGCAVYTPAGSVVVDPKVGSSGGGFCPPGQAKKGNCCRSTRLAKPLRSTGMARASAVLLATVAAYTSITVADLFVV